MSAPAGVLLLTHTLDLGGTERQLTEVALGLDRRRFSPHVACFHAVGIRADELRAAAVPIVDLPVTSFHSWSALRGGLRLMRYIRRHGIRLVHTFDVPLNIFGVPFARLARTPVVLSSQRAHRNLTPGIDTRLLRLTDQMVDGIVVNCLHMREHLIADEGVAAGLVHLCYNGVDLAGFAREGPVARLPPSENPEEEIVIGVVCALRPEKGLLTLLDAFAEVHRNHPKTRLLIVGSGPMLSQLQERAAERRIEGATAFVSKTANVAPWLRAMDIFVLPSLSEALSNSLMEAMACGCCTMASRVGGNPELIGEDTRGLLFPKEDVSSLAQALDRLVRDQGLRMCLAEASHSFLCHGFGQSQSVSRMGEIYSSFLDGNSHA